MDNFAAIDFETAKKETIKSFVLRMDAETMEAIEKWAAMVPLQVYNTLRVPAERKRLEHTDILIIGGRQLYRCEIIAGAEYIFAKLGYTVGDRYRGNA